MRSFSHYFNNLDLTLEHYALSFKLKAMTIERIILAFAFAFGSVSFGIPSTPPVDVNLTIVQSVANMPTQGGYSVKHEAGFSLMNALNLENTFQVKPQLAQPSFCSMGTYVVFLSALQKLLETSVFPVPTRTLKRLDVPQSIDSLFKDDGKNAWGRWNANGPGTARLFYLLKIGKNFTDRKLRRPGDFLKIFFTDDVGMKERGHSVIYLGERKNPLTQDPEIQYWSSNQPDGYGKVWLSEKKMIHAIYSRLDRPENLTNLETLPEWDEYLRTLLSQPSTFAEALKMSGVKSR